jgi:hypothetical protein
VLGFRVSGLVFGVKGQGFLVWDRGFRGSRSSCMVRGLGFRLYRYISGVMVKGVQ